MSSSAKCNFFCISYWLGLSGIIIIIIIIITVPMKRLEIVTKNFFVNKQIVFDEILSLPEYHNIKLKQIKNDLLFLFHNSCYICIYIYKTVFPKVGSTLSLGQWNDLRDGEVKSGVRNDRVATD